MDKQKNSKNLLISDSSLLSISKPEELSYTLIHNIGKNYFTLRKQARNNCCFGIFDSLFHNNQEIACKLRHFKSEDYYEKWLFLATCYAKLPNNNGQIAKTIRALFQAGFKHIPRGFELVYDGDKINVPLENLSSQHVAKAFTLAINNYYITTIDKDYFQHDIHDTYLGSTHLHSLPKHPENISNALIQNLGIDYLQKYALEKKGCAAFFSRLIHHNQGVATSLKKYSAANSAYEKWLFLAESYASLNESHGQLSNAILRLFSSAFQQNPHTSVLRYNTGRYSTGSYQDYYPPIIVSSALKGIVNNYYANQYRQEMLLQNRKVI